MEEWKLGRNFILTLVNQIIKSKSKEEMSEIIKVVFENIDTNISVSYILSYLVFVTDFNTENIILEQLPGESMYSNGVWLFKKNEEETKILFEKLKF